MESCKENNSGTNKTTGGRQGNELERQIGMTDSVAMAT